MTSKIGYFRWKTKKLENLADRVVGVTGSDARGRGCGLRRDTVRESRVSVSLVVQNGEAGWQET